MSASSTRLLQIPKHSNMGGRYHGWWVAVSLDRLHRKRFEERNLRMSSANEDEFTLDRPGLSSEEKALSCP